MRFFRSLIRRQNIENDAQSESKLDRCLSTFDLTLLGIGSTLGLGIYVIAGQVASTKAGPAVIISFFIAAVASVFAGLCYAEFGARVPRAGSAYVYSYVTVGELMAFIIGWNLILEYVIGAASVARGYSGYIDSLMNKRIEKCLTEIVPIDFPSISKYPDFLSFGIIIILTVTLCFGVQLSSKFNNFFTGVNLLVVLYAVICGAFKANIQNWKLENVPKHAGVGGFMPFGVSGMMSGAATCFYAFIGFDVIATTGEEVKNPQRSIPFGIVVSLLVVFAAYAGVSSVQTLMWPYYDQDNATPLPYVFGMVGWPLAELIISAGALAGLSTSLLCSMFPLPRILYAMGSDGLIFRFLANINPTFKTPIAATIISGLLAGAMAMMFEIKELADMMSIGTLLAYSLVAFSVLILRYKCSDQDLSNEQINSGSVVIGVSSISLDNAGRMSQADSREQLSPKKNQNATIRVILMQMFNLRQLRRPNKLSSKLSTLLSISIFIFIIIFDALMVFEYDSLSEMAAQSVAPTAAFFFLILFCSFCLWMQPSSDVALSFKVPMVPLIPILSLIINMYLMLQLSVLTWIRFAVWMIIGLLIYFGYGVWNSSLRKPPSSENVGFCPQPQKLELSASGCNDKPTRTYKYSTAL